MNEILDNLEVEDSDILRGRHGCVTAWLILMIITNSLTTLSYLLFGNTIAENLPSQPSPIIISAIGGISILNVIFSVMIFQWKKVGFYGFIYMSAIAFVINISLGIGIVKSTLGLAGFAILYGVLQIKGKNGNSAWSGLE